MNPSRYDDLAIWHRARCGERLAQAREAAGLGLHEVAHRIAATDPTVIRRYETEGVLPPLARMYAIADALGVTVDSIWGFHE